MERPRGEFGTGGVEMPIGIPLQLIAPAVFNFKGMSITARSRLLAKSIKFQRENITTMRRNAAENAASRTPAPRASIKADGDWKSVYGRADDVLINGRLYTDPKKPGAGTMDGMPRKGQESNWFVTVNPNKAFDELHEPEARRRFDVAMQHFTDHNVIMNYFIFGPVDPHYALDVPQDVIKGIEPIIYTVEKGEILHRLHCHFTCYVQHYSQIFFDCKKLARDFKQFYNEIHPALDISDDKLRLNKGVYCAVNRQQGSGIHKIMRQYMLKGMQAS